MALEKIGRYQISGLLGKGANSLVYRAHDPRFRRDVAIKLITVPVTARHGNWQRRFEREIQAAGQLSHRHIATYYDADVEVTQPYVVMELLDGGTLRDRLLQGALPWDQAVTLLLPLCQALAYAHRQGIVHRDVKPANVMFKSSGTLKLVDFGLARWLEDQHVSQTDATKGTLAYMAPEQLRKEVDARSDIYALGIILIETISGQNVQLKADLVQTIEALTSDEPVDLRPLMGIAPPFLIDIIRQMVAKDPGERYGNCKQVCQDLEAVLAYATVDWRSSPETAQVRLLNPHRMALPAEAGSLVSHLFPGTDYKSVEIELEFGQGYSGTRVFLVYPTRSDGTPELPAVIKMGPIALVEEELSAYDDCIRHKLPAIARIEGEAIFPLAGNWAALRYSLAGEGVTKVESLRIFYRHASTESLLALLDDLFGNMKQIWLHGRAEAGFRRQTSYDSLLPVNLFVRPLSPPPQADIQPIHADMTLGPWLKQGDYVRLEGFVEEEQDENTITLNFPDARNYHTPSFRLRLNEIDDINRFQVNPTITGQVLMTRYDLLHSSIKDAFGPSVEITEESLTFPDGRTLPNPIRRLPKLLSERASVKIACIHGDLNMENILVDEYGRVQLIDFASARPDHVLHDFLRLETAVMIVLLPGDMADSGLSFETIIEFYEKLHCATFESRNSKDKSFGHPALEKPFQMIMAIRKLASTCFFNQSDWTEYYRGLIIYLLGTLKYKTLDREPTAPLPKQIACTAAATLQHMLDAPPDCGPQHFGRYQVMHELGRGGMGVVYQAHDPQMDRIVAIKTLPRQWISDPHLRQYLHREAKTIANLQHPAIVPVFDFGESNGQPYLVMGYMRGGSLNDRLQAQGSLRVDDALAIMNRLAPALDKAHAKGIIHRDIKPANIIFNEEGQAFLADFGIARDAGSVTGSATSFSAGTTAFTSPEQIRGDVRIDARSDIYAMGATLFMMLTGKPPYKSDTPQGLAELHLTAPVPDIRESRPDLPQAIQQVINRSMAKEPSLRFDSAGEMVEQLQSALVPQARPEKEPVPLSVPEPDYSGDISKSLVDRGLTLAVWIIGAAIVLGLVVLGANYLNGLGELSGTTTTTTVTATSAPLETEPALVTGSIDETTYILALDTSASMADEKLETTVSALTRFAETLTNRDEIAIFVFSDQVRELLPLNRVSSDQAELKQALNGLQAKGESALYDAICAVTDAASAAFSEDTSGGEPHLYKVVVFTDGTDTNSDSTESEVLTLCIPQENWPPEIKLYTVGIGEETDETFLNRVANRTNGKAYRADLNTITEALGDIAREQ